METPIPSAEEVRKALEPLTLRQLGVLSLRSGVPEATIYKIKLNTTTNPGIETVRKFWPFLAQALAEQRHPAPAAEAQA